MTTRHALKQYENEMLEGEVNTADPHRLIQMLLEGALKNIAIAKFNMPHKDFTRVAAKGSAISTAISIIGCLQGSLDMDSGGQIADNLNKLYDYMMVRLVEANLNNNEKILDEVTNLLTEIKSGWDDIREEALAIFAAHANQSQQNTIASSEYSSSDAEK